MFGYIIKEHKRYWGARAIYRGFRDDYHIDLLMDRQSVKGMSDPPNEDDEAFIDWVNKTGLPWLRKEVKRIGLSTDENREIVFKEGDYEIKANPNSSYGYLYIGAAQRP